MCSHTGQGDVQTYIEVLNNGVLFGSLQHAAIPLLQSLGLRDLLFGRMTVEDVVISFTWRARPNMSCFIPVVDKVYENVYSKYVNT